MGLGSDATHLPDGLPSINPLDYQRDAFQHGVRVGASPTL